MVGFTADMKLGMILSDGSHGFPCVLPNRQEKIRDHCEVDNKDYPQSRAAILENDHLQYKEILPPEVVVLTANAIRRYLRSTDHNTPKELVGVAICWNFYNYCHTSPYSNAGICS